MFLAGLSSTVGEDEFQHKPASTSLAAVFKGIADSLEFHGSPVPYSRHIWSEYERISAKYRSIRGKTAPEMLPDWFGKDFPDHKSRGWNNLAEPLGLDVFAKEIGNSLNEVIAVRNGFVVEFLNAYQEQTVKMMTSDFEGGYFSGLKSEFLQRFEAKSAIDHAVWVEYKLSDEMAILYRKFLTVENFKKSDFDALEKFYEHPDGHDVLTELGKDRLTRRIAGGIDFDHAVALTRDKKHFAGVLAMLAPIEKGLAKVDTECDRQLSEEDAESVKSYVRITIDQIAELGHLELVLANLEWALDKINEQSQR